MSGRGSRGQRASRTETETACQPHSPTQKTRNAARRALSPNASHLTQCNEIKAKLVTKTRWPPYNQK